MDGIYILHFQLMWKYGEELCVVNNFQISDACPSIFIENGFTRIVPMYAVVLNFIRLIFHISIHQTVTCLPIHK